MKGAAAATAMAAAASVSPQPLHIAFGFSLGTVESKNRHTGSRSRPTIKAETGDHKNWQSPPKSAVLNIADATLKTDQN